MQNKKYLNSICISNSWLSKISLWKTALCEIKVQIIKIVFLKRLYVSATANENNISKHLTLSLSSQKGDAIYDVYFFIMRC